MKTPPLTKVQVHLLDRRTTFLTRWHREPVLQRFESLAEHHSTTANIAYEVGLMLKYLGVDVDPPKLCVYGNYHDATEVITGDLPKGIKHGEGKSPTLNALALRELEEQAARQLWEGYPPFLREHLQAVALENGLNEIEEQVLKYADSCSALAFMIVEAEFGNNFMQAKAEREWAEIRGRSWPWLVQLRKAYEVP
jgi:5'-deoxynucleotidase